MSNPEHQKGSFFVRMQSVKAIHTKSYVRLLCLVALAVLLAVASLGVIPICTSMLADNPMPAWAGGIDEAIADEGDASADDDSSGDDAASDDADDADSATSGSSASSSSSAASAASSSRSASASSSASSNNRGYVGPWYAINDGYVAQVEERFDSITESEYANTMTRTGLIAVAIAAALLAIVMFVRAHRVQSKIRKRRR